MIATTSLFSSSPMYRPTNSPPNSARGALHRRGLIHWSVYPFDRCHDGMNVGYSHYIFIIFSLYFQLSFTPTTVLIHLGSGSGMLCISVMGIGAPQVCHIDDGKQVEVLLCHAKPGTNIRPT